MAWTFSVLVVANVTATSPELVEALTERAKRDDCRFTLVVPMPAPGSDGREAAQRGLDDKLAALRKKGLEVEGMIGDHDPLNAAVDAYDPERFDEIVISTLPTGTSKWLQLDLPHRIERATGVPVTHVVAKPPRPQPHVEHVEKEQNGYGLLEPFRAL
jgi:hypothetical protein